jgi:hypothetical protein
LHNVQSVSTRFVNLRARPPDLQALVRQLASG